MNKTLVRIVCIVLAVLMLFGVLASILASVAYATPTRAQLNALNDDYADLKQKMKSVDSQINDFAFQSRVAKERKQVLDEKVGLILDQIDNLNEQIETCQRLIEEKELEISVLQQKQEEQWELYKTRLRAMEMNGSASYYAIVFGARSFSDLLFRLDAIRAIARSDEQVYQDLLTAEANTRRAQEELGETILEEEEKKVELAAREAELEEQIAANEALMTELEQNIEEYRAYYQELEEERSQLYLDILAMEKAIKEAEAVKGTGTFMWPAAKAGHVTSRFGWRLHPILGVNKYHEGIDIGGLGMGCNVYASDGGKVITSALSDTYGNYIVINHGNGYTTLYAHLSKRRVSAGDTVKKGDLIGNVGSTGRSNGPHLHFEVWFKGERQDPLKYFSGVKVDADA